MKKIFVLLVFLATVSTAYGATNLWQYYEENGLEFPSLAERAIDYYEAFGAKEEYRGTAEQNTALLEELQEPMVGAFNPAGGLTYRLQSSIGTTNTSIRLSSFKNRSGIALTMTLLATDIGYGTLSPQTSRSEFISFTGVTQNADGTATLTGVSRGLSDISPFTASTTLREAHPGQSVFILSDSPQLFEEYAKKRSDMAITGAWTFNSTIPTTSLSPVASTAFTTKGYVDALTNQGAATSTESVGGIVELATATEAASSTPTTSTVGYVLQAQNATSTPTYSCDASGTTGALCSPVAGNDGYLNTLWINKLSNYDWTGYHTFTNASTTNATTTLLTVSGASWFDGALTVSATTTIANGLTIGELASTTNLIISGSCVGCGKTFSSMVAVAGATTTANRLGQNNTEASTASDTYAKLKTIIVYVGGTITTEFECYATNASAKAKIYVNGIARGTEQSCPSSGVYDLFTETIYVNAGASVQLYALRDVGTTYVQNFRLYGSFSEQTNYSDSQ